MLVIDAVLSAEEKEAYDLIVNTVKGLVSSNSCSHEERPYQQPSLQISLSNHESGRQRLRRGAENIPNWARAMPNYHHGMSAKKNFGSEVRR